METFEIDHPHNEASALLGIQNAQFLEKRGWNTGFWIVSDEGPAAKALAALGRKPDGEWEVARIKTTHGEPWTSKRCEDCETLARAGSHVYVFGSQYGTKKGPLQPKRHFIARFNEALIDGGRRPAVAFDLVRRPFALHRIMNDAIRDAGIETMPMPARLQKSFVDKTVKRGRKKQKRWNALIQRGDTPINIEGATFVDGGRLLVGMRYPVTTDGHPIIVEIEGIDRLFEDDAAPPATTAVRVLTNIGSARRPAGIRELDARSGQVHVITGDMDERLLTDGASPARSEHWVFTHQHEDSSLERVTATRIRKFGPRAHVEGIALDGDDVWYVHDDETIRIERAEGNS